MMSRRLTLGIVLFLVASAAAAQWQEVGPGVDYQRVQEGSIDVHVTRIDLANEEIRVIATHQNQRGMRVSQYANEVGALVAINADYFDESLQPIGLAVGPCGPWEGTRDTAREGVVAVGGTRATIRRQADVMDPPEPWIEAAVSGWPMIVTGCRASGAGELPGSDAFTRSPHPRTAVGLSADGRTMYFVVADGRREGVPGMTLAELAGFMRSRLGVCSAMNLDGGGSSAMWVGDRIVNQPSDGRERRVADHLAVVLRAGYAGCETPDRVLSSGR